MAENMQKDQKNQNNHNTQKVQNESKDDKGILFDKVNDTNAWYTDIINKCDLIEYTDVSGCYILKPRSQFIWDKIRDFMNHEFKKRGIKNASFPLLIPEHFLMKEKEHVEGFSPEVAWVTETGNTKLSERLAIRPTSETIMYPAYSKWIRSYNDLPLRLNQWCSVVRWEFKNPMPFLRSREFLWQEGHTVFATKQEADDEAHDILTNIYAKTYKELLAIPSLMGRKSDREKFAGADYTLSCEVFLPVGKAIQGCTSHYLGQNFSKAFDIKFKDKDGSEKYAYQNSWGFSTRSLGVMLMAHSDSKGLVLPPRVAENKVIIIPVLGKEDKGNGKENDNEKVMHAAKEIAHALHAFDPIIDDRSQYSYGWKLNDAELKGYPIRIELGKKELEKGMATVVRRDLLTKVAVEIPVLKDEVHIMLEKMHDDLYDKAKKFLDASIEESYDLERIKEIVASGRIALTVFSGEKEADEIIREKTGGKTLVIPFDSKITAHKTCPFTGHVAKYQIYIAKSL